MKKYKIAFFATLVLLALVSISFYYTYTNMDKEILNLELQNISLLQELLKNY